MGKCLTCVAAVALAVLSGMSANAAPSGSELIKASGVTGGLVVHIGDDPHNDIAGAKSAGSPAIWMNRENRVWQHEGFSPDAEISTLHELPALLKKLF